MPIIVRLSLVPQDWPEPAARAYIRGQSHIDNEADVAYL